MVIVLDFNILYSDVMKLDKTIRYAAVQNNIGEKICGGIRKNLTPILTDEEMKMMHYYASQRWGTRKNIEHKIGLTKYAMAEYDKLKRISFPIDEKYLLMIATEIQADHTKIISDVLRLIHNSKNM